MKTFSIVLVGLVITSTAGGCGCCNWCLPQQPVAVAPACPPVAPCDPCATAPVTYAPTNVAPYTQPQW